MFSHGQRESAAILAPNVGAKPCTISPIWSAPMGTASKSAIPATDAGFQSAEPLLARWGSARLAFTDGTGALTDVHTVRDVAISAAG